jgi:hypothetical protein
VCDPLSTTVDSLHKVHLDPSYYSFEDCKCEAGYDEQVEHKDGKVDSLVCVVPEVGQVGKVKLYKDGRELFSLLFWAMLSAGRNYSVTPKAPTPPPPPKKIFLSTALNYLKLYRKHPKPP